jgi:CRP-like cAMP-binding protein
MRDRRGYGHERVPPRDSSSSAINLISNLILDALPGGEQALFLSHARLIRLRPGQVLYEANKPISSVYFPNSGVVYLLAILRDGTTAEVGMIGSEGFVGAPVILGGHRSPFRVIAQIGGTAHVVNPDVLLRLLQHTPTLESLLHRYVLIQSFQIAQVAACNSVHEMPKRLARWLLTYRDKARSDLLPATHEFLSQVLGCRRPSVTTAAQVLRKAGAISYLHGKLRITNRKALEKAACECYELMHQFGRLQ